MDKLTQDLAIKANAQSQTRLALEKSLIDLDSRAEVKRLQLASFQSQLARDRQLHAQGLLSVEQLKKSELATAQAEIQLKQGGPPSESTRSKPPGRSSKAWISRLAGSARRRPKPSRQRHWPRRAPGATASWTVGRQRRRRGGGPRARPWPASPTSSSFRVDASVSDVHARELSVGLPAVVVAGEQRFDGTVAESIPPSPTA